VFFGAAAASEGLHFVQHASFFLTATLFWWTVLRREARALAGLAALFTTMLHTGALGALMALAKTPWYAGYALEDQQLAGLVMWVPAGLAYPLAAPMRYLIFFLLLIGAGCEAQLPDREPATGGSPRRGKELILKFGCGSCHTIPGVRGATATVGPPLEHFRKRVYIAGRAANNAEQLLRWIVNPRSLDPQTAMPAVGADEAQARDIAAYLYSQ
jgi:cytochrome c2